MLCECMYDWNICRNFNEKNSTHFRRKIEKIKKNNEQIRKEEKENRKKRL